MHPTEQQLIDYEFKLNSDAQAGEIAEHLGRCEDCRQRLDGLRRKFAALDLLRQEPGASEDLISRAVEQARQPAGPRVVSLSRRAWISVAATLLIGGLLLLLIPDLRDSSVPVPESAKEPSTEAEYAKRGPKMESAPIAERRPRPTAPAAPETDPGGVVDSPEGVVAKNMLAFVPGQAKGSFSEGRGGVDAPAPTTEAVREKPPFAPASAIELVTLPRRENVQLTIYNSADLTLVRERRNLTLKKGWNWLQLMWANTLIDPTSLSLEPLQQGDKIEIQQLVFPARLRELGRWLIKSQVSGQVPFEITYFTSGLGWRAFYMGTLSQDETTMRLQGYVRVDNRSGEDYDNAQTRLIVGTVHMLDQIAELAKRQYPYDRPVSIRMLGEAGGMAGHRYAGQETAYVTNGVVAGDMLGRLNVLELRRKEIKKEGLSEYFLYTIEGTETIPDKWGKRLLSLEAEDIDVKSLYKYDQERWGELTIRYVSFANDEEHNLGDTPLPDGAVKIYSRSDSAGSLSYVGGTGVKYIPVDEEVELNLGAARLVEVEPKLMGFKTDNYVFDTKNNVAGWDEIRTWKIELTNARTLPVEIEITRGFGTAYWTLQLRDKEVSYEKHDATHARFEAEIKPRTKRAFEYTVTTYHGAREEAMTK